MFTLGAKVYISMLTHHESEEARPGVPGYGFIIDEGGSRLAIEEYHGTKRRHPHRHIIYDYSDKSMYKQTTDETVYLQDAISAQLVSPPWPSPHDRRPMGMTNKVHSDEYEFAPYGFQTVPESIPQLDPPSEWPAEYDPEPLPPEVQEENLETALYPPVDLSFDSHR